MTQTTRLPFGTALALAQRVLSAPLAAVLAEADTAMPVWFTLNALGLRGPMPVADLVGLLATNGLDEPAVRALLDELAAEQSIEERNSTVTLTGSGTERYRHLRDRIESISRRIFARFDADRVEAARGLLQEIAQTDPAELARS